MSDTINELLSRLGLSQGTGIINAEMLALIEEWRAFFDETATVDLASGEIAAWAAGSFHASPDPATKLEALAECAANPLLGAALFLTALPGFAFRQAERWWEFLFSEESATDFTNGWNIKKLPAPGPGRKYLIISDIHRDAESDDEGPFESRSIDHFKFNAPLYETVLQFVLDNPEYTLLEGGDCEELWFVREVAEFPRKQNGLLDMGAKMTEIMDSPHNVGVYQKLRELHEAGRYLRIYGNHDSFLRPQPDDGDPTDPNAELNAGQVLDLRMNASGSHPFEIHDAFLIPGVKTMREHSAADIVQDTADLIRGTLTAEAFADKLLEGRLGMDAAAYTDTCSMLVTHGHQFDFWNSPENEMLGMLLANSVGMFIDRNMDPFLDLQGIALQGNPVLDFADMFSGWMFFNSWLSRGPSIQYAHQVMHRPNRERVLKDGIMYCESLAAFYGAFGIALNYEHPDTGVVTTPAQSRIELDLTTLDGIRDYLHRHHFHHICIGHTHTPHSQPYFTLQNVEELTGPFSGVVESIREALPDLLEPTFKTNYFNSGTAGWHEGVIWAIEIGESGQAKLAFWTDRSTGFEYMDWELSELDEELRGGLLDGVRSAIGGPVDEIRSALEDVYGRLEEVLKAYNVPIDDLAAHFQQPLILPIEALAARMMTALSETTTYEDQLNDLGGVVEEQVEELKRQVDRVRAFTLDITLSMKRRVLRGFDATADTDRFTMRVPFSDSRRARLELFKNALEGFGIVDDEAHYYGALAMSLFNDFPRSLPFFSSIDEEINPIAALRSMSDPVVQNFFSTLWLYPAPGRTLEIDGVTMKTTFVDDGSDLVLTVTLGDAAATPPIG
jgi:hypothetical protein